MTTPAPRQTTPIQRAALAVLEPVRLEVELMRADADAAERLQRETKRNADAQRDVAERAVRMAAEARGAERVLQLIGRIARG